MNRALLLLMACLCSNCDAPAVFPGADKRQNTEFGRIEGTIIVNSKARGKVVLFLYDANRPPPPYGTGRPLTFTVVSKEVVFGSALDADLGPFTAPFALSLVAPGNYFITGFVDADDDFVPWYGVTAGATEGDVAGAAINPTTRAFRVIHVGSDEAGQPLPTLDVPVSFSDASALPVDRPVFTVAGSLSKLSASTLPQHLEIHVSPIEDGPIHAPKAAFLARLVDDDGDGTPDDSNGDGLPDVWPRVVVRKMAEGDNLLLDENDLDQNGIVDSEGLDYAHKDVPADGLPDAVVLGAAFDVTGQLALLTDSQGRPKTTATPLPSLRLVLLPRAFDVGRPSAPQPLSTIPTGRYAITVIQQTGQTWRVPNELGVLIPGLPQVASQSFFIQVEP